MARNLIIYILCLIAAVFYFLFYRMWVSWFLLILLIVMPIISVLLCIVSSFKFKVNISAPANLYIGDTSDITVKNVKNGFMLLSYCSLTIKITDIMTDTSRNIKVTSQGQSEIKIPVDTTHCGTFIYQITDIGVYDAFGLFKIRKPGGDRCEAVILPIKKIPPVLPDMNGFKAKSLKRSMSPYSEIYDIRNYTEGDPIKNIHWKASAKKDIMLVKEAQEESYGHARVILELASDRDILDNNLGELVFTSTFFLDHEIFHKIRIIPPERTEIAFSVESKRDLDMAILKILHLKLPEGETT